MRKLGKTAKYILLLVIAAPRLLGMPAAMKQAQTSASWWADVWQWFIAHDLHFWVPMLFLLAWFLAYDLRSYWRKFFERFWHNKELYSKLMQEHDDMRDLRAKFWSSMKRAYSAGMSQVADNTYRKLEDLVAAADTPQTNTDANTIKLWEQSLTGDSKKLWEFVAWVFLAQETMSLSAIMKYLTAKLLFQITGTKLGRRFMMKKKYQRQRYFSATSHINLDC